MREEIKNWLKSPVLCFYEIAAIIALTTKQFVLAILCGIIIPATGIIVEWFRNRRKKINK